MSKQESKFFGGESDTTGNSKQMGGGGGGGELMKIISGFYVTVRGFTPEPFITI